VAGNRILSLAKRDPALKEELAKAGVRAGDVAAYLGRERVLALVGDEAALIAPARAILAETLSMWGLNGSLDVIVTHLERHAVRTLYDISPGPLPPRFEQYVAGVLAKGD
jgi:hypothetical protein